MKITPLDIQQQEFRRALFGVDRQEVQNFLELCRDTVEELSRETARSQEALQRCEAELQRHRERERVLQETLLTAQRLSEEIRINAQKEAEIVVAQAQMRGEKILENAQQRMVELFEEIHELKRQKVQFETGLRRIIDWHAKLLEIRPEEDDPRQSQHLASVEPMSPRRSGPPPAPVVRGAAG